MAKLVDAHVSEACGAIHGGSSPLFGTSAEGISTSTMASCPVSQYNHLLFEPGWRNWQTRTFEGRVEKSVEVQVLFRAQVQTSQIPRPLSSVG